MGLGSNCWGIFAEDMRGQERLFKEVMASLGDNSLVAMPNLRKRDTGLPVNIYVDQAPTYRGGGHAKRIKVQLNKADTFQLGNTVPMDISENPQFMEEPMEMEISKKDINEVREFVIEFREELALLADNKITLSDFKVELRRRRGGE